MIAEQFGFLSSHCSGDGIEFGEGPGHISRGRQIREGPCQVEGKAAERFSPKDIPVGDQTCDYVVCIHYLEHYTDTIPILREWWRILKPGGKLILALPERGPYPAVGQPGCNPDHRVDFTPSSVRDTLKEITLDFKVLMEGSLGQSLYCVVRKGKKSLVTAKAELGPIAFSVIMPFMEKPEMTKNCLNSLLSTSNPSEVICVDNGSEARFTYGDKRVRFIRLPQNIGFPKAVNRAMKEVTEEFLVIINNDIMLKPGGIDRLLAGLKDPSVAIVGQTGGKLNDRLELQSPTTSEPDYIEMYSVALRKSVWERVGPLDEGMSPGYAEDSDWCIRATKLGYRLACVDNICTHLERQTFGDEQAKKLRARNTEMLRKKHLKGTALWVMCDVGMNGGTKVVQHLAKAMQDDGWNVGVCSMRGWSSDQGGWDSFKRLTLPDISPPYNIVFSTFHASMPAAAPIEADYHIALIQSDEPEWKVDYSAEWNFRIQGFKHIIIANHMRNFGKKYGMRIIGQIDNGVDNLNFCPTWTFAREWPHKFMVVMKSSPVWYTGINHLEEAIPELRARFPDLGAACLGGTKPHWPCGVEHYRTVKEKEICKIYNSVSCVVIPSLIEGSSLVPLEAMASGTPVITTRIGVDYGIHGENVLFIPYQDTPSIVEAVTRIFREPDLRHKLVAGGIGVTRERTWEHEQQQFMEIIRGLK